MIGSHDSYTFEKPILSAYNISKKLWKTQCKTIDEQYAYGVRMFDIRVAKTVNGKWVACHGLVDFHKHWDKIEDICKEYASKYPKAIYRIVLERGGKIAQRKFKKQCKGLCSKYPNLWRIDIKSTKNWLGSVDNNNESLYKKGYKFALVNTWEPPAYEQHGSVSLNNIFKCDLKASAQQINASVLQSAQTAIADNISTAYPALLRASHLWDIASKNNLMPSVLTDKGALYFIDYCTNEYD